MMPPKRAGSFAATLPVFVRLSRSSPSRGSKSTSGLQLKLLASCATVAHAAKLLRGRSMRRIAFGVGSPQPATPSWVSPMPSPRISCVTSIHAPAAFCISILM